MPLLRHVQRYAAAALFSLLLVTPVLAQPALWVVRSAHTTIYLFGTVHLLPNDTDWHSPALDKALAASDSLTIELTDDDDATMQALVLQNGLIPPIRCRTNSALPKTPPWHRPRRPRACQVARKPCR